MTTLDRRGFLLGFATVVFFSSLAADFWRNSISWYGYAAVVVVIATTTVIVLIRQRALRFDRLPWPLVAFIVLAAVSTIWSAYPLYTAGAALTQLIATVAGLAVALILRVGDIVRTLGWALRGILVLSLLFELIVSIVVRAPVFPVWVTAEDRIDPPRLLYWSRDLLLEGGKIQGIVGSSSLLAMIALLALIVVGVELAAGTVGRVNGVLSLALAALMVVLTRSATIYVGIVAVVVVLAMILVMRRAATPRARRLTYVGIGAALVALIAGGLILRVPLLAVMGKSSELTGRIGIWDAVIGLAQQRPVVGWGWVSFWPPWIEPFRGLIVRGGVVQLHAHNAWLDVWLQLGVIGLIVFGALIVSCGIRSWFLATDRVMTERSDPGRFSTLALLPALVLTALLVQSLAESRLLLEGNWVLLVVIATTTKLAITGRSVTSLAAGAQVRT